jgi:hypothetical protein
MIGEHLIVKIEVPFAFHQDTPGRRVKIINGRHKARVQRFLQGEK